MRYFRFLVLFMVLSSSAFAGGKSGNKTGGSRNYYSHTQTRRDGHTTHYSTRVWTGKGPVYNYNTTVRQRGNSTRTYTHTYRSR